MASSSSSSSVPPRKGWTYDVFLSFRGDDTRNHFVDHLYAALLRNGIQTFKDDKMLGGGQPISEELVKAIKESRFAVVVFSKNYANSSWCLQELSKIMECQHQLGQKVLPVFYHVDPSDVWGQKRDFATAFETHEDKFKGEMDKVNKWREALTAAASLSGQFILPIYLATQWELKLIEGIVLPWEEIKESLSADVFKSMKNLRVLDCYKNFTYNEPTFLPDELRWFCWSYYPFSSLPVAHMRKLVGLEMEEGKIKHLWQGKKMMLQNLKFIRLQFCESLTRFPDVSGAPNIERLDLSFCRNVVEVDESVGSLKKLLHLDMCCCIRLKCLPSMLHMESLETIILFGCSSLERIPEFSSCMVNLSHLDISQCETIERVPSSIKYLSNLTYLNLCGGKSLENIPNSICELKCLTTLNLSNCWKLGKLPDDFQSMQSLEVLHIRFQKPINLRALTNFSSLRRLYLDGEIGDNDFPENLHGLSSLEELHISWNSKLIKLPESISHLSSLKHLQLHSCSRLQSLHGLPSGIQVLIADFCGSLEKIEDLSKEYECLSKIRISNSPKLLEDEDLDKILDQSFLEKWAAVDGCVGINIPGSNIPSWFKEQHDGCRMALKLPPKWQTKIIGFAMCFVTTGWTTDDEINFRFENDGVFAPNPKANEIEEAVNGNTRICYIPFSMFEQFHGGNDNDFEGEYWFHMTKGNFVFEISRYSGKVVRCGARVIYKEDVASIQQTIPSISSYYWSWKLTKSFTNSFTCHLSPP